jgi:RNA polymerase sigma-54 factor
MMRIIGPRPQITIIPTIRSARPPEEYMELLTKSEREFRDYIQEVESTPQFQNLMKEGHIKKTSFRGRIPRHLYEEYQDRQFMDFLHKYDIENKGDWQQDFFRDDARRRIKELSVKYGVPRGHLIHALEYCRFLKLSWAGYDANISSYDIRLDDKEFREPPMPQTYSETDEPIAELAELMEEYEITEAEFKEYFLNVNVEPEYIAEELGIPLSAARDIIDLVERVEILSLMQVNVIEQPVPKREQNITTVATIHRLKEPPRTEIQVDNQVIYNSRYVIQMDEELDKDTSEFIERLRLINQRKSLTFRIVMFIYEYQYQYFVSGDELHLKPLTQAQISKEAGEHESSVSRILRDKYLDTPEGNLPLKFFCQSKGDVIHRLINIKEVEELKAGKRDKPFSDMELAEILEREYETKISRRTVTYYRNKFKDTPKFYARKKTAINHQNRVEENV